MAVVYVPPDQRWSNLGAALGNLAGNAVGAYEDKTIAAGVQAIRQDASIPADQKVSTITAKFGTPGFNSYLNQLKGEAVAQQISASQTAQQLTQAQTTTADITNKVKLATAPASIQEAFARPKLLEAQAAGTQAEAAVNQAKIPLVGAQTSETQADAQLKQQQAANAQLQAKMAQRLAESGSIDDFTKNEIPDATPEEIQRVRRGLLLDAANPLKGATEELDKIQQGRTERFNQANAAQIRSNEPKPLDTARQKTATTYNTLGAATSDFVDALNNDPKTGLLSGAPLKAWWMAKGGDVSDPNLLRMYEEQNQMLAESARGESQFLSAQGIHLASSIVPSLGHTPIPNLVAVHAMATRALAAVDSELSGAAANEQKAPLETAQKRWQKIASDTDLTGSYVTKEGGSVVMRGADQVDPTTLKPLMKATETIKFKSGDTISAARILQYAQQQKVTPQDVLAKMAQAQGGLSGGTEQ